MANVLLAEDDGDVASVLALSLEGRGHRVRRASDGASALALARREEIEVAVVDLLLPKKSGMEVAAEIRERTGGSVPVILISGIYRGAAQRQKAMERTGAVAFLEKPFLPAELIRLVEDAIRTWPGGRTAHDPATEVQTDPGAPSFTGRSPTPEPLADEGAHQERREVERIASKPARGGRWQGTLAETPFARLLFELYEARVTGGLLVVREPVKKIVFFQDGLPVFVKSNLLQECLGKVLVKEGMITEDQCRESLRRLQKSKRPQGEILVEMRALARADLDRGLRLQTLSKILDLFSWPAGKYHWSAQMFPPGDARRPFDHPLPILIEGVRGKMDAGRVRRDIDRSLDQATSLRPTGSAALQLVSLGPDEKAFVASLDGRKSLRERIAEGADAEARIRLAYALLVAGLLELGDKVRSGSTGRALGPAPRQIDDLEELGTATISSPPPVPTRPSAPSLAADLDGEVERVLEAERRFQRGVALLHDGRPTSAVESLERAVTLCPDEPEFRLELGVALLAASARDVSLVARAIAELREVVAQRPEMAAAWRKLAEALGRSGDRASAIAAYERSLALDPASSEARAGLAALGGTR